MGDVASADGGESSNTAVETTDESSAVETQPVTNNSSTSDGNISFAKNSTRVDVSNAQVDAIRTYLSENPNSNLVIEGHASSEGDRFYNIGLSRRRAQAVKDELVRGGVDADRIKVVAQGSKYPVADNSTESGRAQNRRVELKYE
jgi:outer membrane protein OmpA-like peptidoglycan-associated protein